VVYVLDVPDPSSGLCHGVLRSHVGVFRLADMHTLPDDDDDDDDDIERTLQQSRRPRRHETRRAPPSGVEELLTSLGLQVDTQYTVMLGTYY